MSFRVSSHQIRELIEIFNLVQIKLRNYEWTYFIFYSKITRLFVGDHRNWTGEVFEIFNLVRINLKSYERKSLIFLVQKLHIFS